MSAPSRFACCSVRVASSSPETGNRRTECHRDLASDFAPGSIPGSSTKRAAVQLRFFCLPGSASTRRSTSGFMDPRQCAICGLVRRKAPAQAASAWVLATDLRGRVRRSAKHLAESHPGICDKFSINLDESLIKNNVDESLIKKLLAEPRFDISKLRVLSGNIKKAGGADSDH